MTQSQPVTAPAAPPDLSIVMPCYNEEAILSYTMTRLLGAFERAGYRLELIAVNNGSWIEPARSSGISRRPTRRLSTSMSRQTRAMGMAYSAACRCVVDAGPASSPRDGQVDAEDVVRLYETVSAVERECAG